VQLDELGFAQKLCSGAVLSSQVVLSNPTAGHVPPRSAGIGRGSFAHQEVPVNSGSGTQVYPLGQPGDVPSQRRLQYDSPRYRPSHTQLPEGQLVSAF
jgi:hypothetical protein